LRHLIAQYLRMDPHEVTIGVGKQGKPFISHPLEFNVTHSGDVIAFAFSMGRNVGIDIERIDFGVDIGTLAPGILSPVELRRFETLEHRERVDAFFVSWSRKEAFLKALGHGLTRPLRGVEVAIGSLSPPILRSVSWQPDLAADCCVVDLSLRVGYAAALAAKGRIEPTICLLDQSAAGRPA
jgi:4'-phosphopantetheinyl transferase